MGTPKVTTETSDSDPTKVIITIRSQRSVQFDVRFSRDGATDLANLFEVFTKSPLAQEYFQESFFIIQDIQQVNLTTLLLSQNFEEQALVETYLKVDQENQYETNAVSEVSIDYTTDFGNDNFINEILPVSLENSP